MEIIKTDQAPAAIGPYAQAVKSGNLVFCSGQIPLKTDGTLISGDIREQAKQVMENLKAVLVAAGSSFEKAVKCTIYLVDMNDFAVVNEVYGSYFNGDHKPARATVGVTALPNGVKVEIDCVAEV
ncbi:RidA family protein [Candidatus Peregrinibacteria bacterium]|nr:RidA family protein [Candidatus Peregrinibacteria bacterium]